MKRLNKIKAEKMLILFAFLLKTNILCADILQRDTLKNFPIYVGHIRKRKIYLNIPLTLSKNERERLIAINNFNKVVDSLLKPEEKEKILLTMPSPLCSLIKVKIPEKFEIYSPNGYEGIFTKGRKVLIQDLLDGIFFPYLELREEIKNIEFTKYENVVIAKPVHMRNAILRKCILINKKVTDSIKLDSVWQILKRKITVEKIHDNFYKIIGETLTREEISVIYNSPHAWEINIYDGDVNGDNQNDLIVDATWKSHKTSHIVSTIFIWDRKEKQVLDVIPPTFSSGDAQVFWKVSFGIDIDNDKFVELVVHDIYYEGEAYSVYKWNGKIYQRIYDVLKLW